MGLRGAPRQPHPAPQQTPVQYLLPEVKAQDSDKICVVIDLDETLVHSSFKVGPAPLPFTLQRGGLEGTALAWELGLGQPGPLQRRSLFAPHFCSP